MPYYISLNKKSEDGKRTIERLLQLRKQLKRSVEEGGVPQRTQKQTLLLATWNIREFDSEKYGPRLDEALFYMAEIIDCFDLVAVQEVRKDLTALNRLKTILGRNWDSVFTDTTLGTRGNEERMAFLYDKRKVSFEGLAGELVLPDQKKKGAKVVLKQLARTPFICGFKAGWTDFMLVTVHILWGTAKAEPPERIEEIRQVATRMKEMTGDNDAWARNVILLGDFNIFEPENKTFQEIIKAGFEVPAVLQSLPTNIEKTRHYDQIALISRKYKFEWTGNAGVFDFYQTVFRDTPEDFEIYKKFVPDLEVNSKGKPRTEKQKMARYKDWRTYQMSDHKPLWVELRIDYSDEYLTRKLA